MKYILMNDLKLLKQKKKMIIVYLIIILSYLLYNSWINKGLNIELIYRTFGLKCTSESLMLDILMYIYNIVSFIYFTLLVFNNDIKTNITNIFLRMNMKKWLITKIVSIINITVILKLLSYILVTLIYIVEGTFNFEIIKCFLINTIWILFIELFVLYGYILFKKIPYILPVFIVLILINYKYLLFNFIAYNNYIFIALLINIILVTIILFNNKKYICIFENINWR